MSPNRLDPTGKQALFQSPVVAAPDQLNAKSGNEGRAALFSSAPRRAGTVVVECSGCRTRTRTGAADLTLRLLSGSLWFPFARHQHWMRCPACGERRWCRIGWTE